MTEQELIKKLEQLKSHIALSPEERDRGLNLFLQKVNEKYSQAPEVEAEKEAIGQPVRVMASFTETLIQSREFLFRGLRVYSSHIFASVLVTILIFGVFGAYSGMSARKALPDNRPLYTLKRALEKTQLTLSFSSSQRSAIRINHLDRRVEELNHLVAKTKANPEKDGVAVINAIRNTQSGINDVKDDLVAVSENETQAEIAELKDLIVQKVSRYQIALGEVSEDLPDDIKNELEPEVAALTTAISEINEVIEKLNTKNEPAVTELASPFDLGATTSGTVIKMNISPSSTITTTANTIGEVDGVMDAGKPTSTDSLINKKSNTLKPVYIPPAPVEEFSLEKDTFEVRIGD